MPVPTQFHPSALLTGKPRTPYALLILNQPINRNAFMAVVSSADLLVCADAGANRLLALQQDVSFPEMASRRLPDVIIGDLDSLSDEASKYYRERSVEIIEDKDQYSTDFMKALKWIRNWSVQRGQASPNVSGGGGREQNGILDVVVLGGLGGRVDQGFSQIHHLYRAQQDEELLHGRIYLLSEQSLTFVLDEGNNEILVEDDIFEENVGIIPVMGPTRISTKGLEWDVDDWLTEFGGQLSTSNHIRSNRIMLTVNGKRPLMTFELAKRFCIAP